MDHLTNIMTKLLIFHQLTCKAAHKLLLPVLVEEVRAEDKLKALVAGLSGTCRQHLIQQSHLMIPHAADAGQRVLNQPQDLPVHHQLLRRGSVGHPQRSPFGAVVGEQEEERLGVTLPLDVLFQPSETRLD